MEQKNMYDNYLQHLIEQDKKRWKLGIALLISVLVLSVGCILLSFIL